MAKQDKDAAPRPAPRLTLVTPPVADADAFAAPLAAALGASDVAAVLLRLEEADERSLINRIKALVPVAQDKEAALIVDGHAGLIARAGADGAHLTGIEPFITAVESLRPDRIAGCGGLATRHDAMTAAENGADYVMFGEPDAEGTRPAFEAIEERVAWWAEVFEIPCVAYAASLEEVARLAAAGADFVALGDFLWRAPDRIAAQVAAAAQQLSLPEDRGMSRRRRAIVAAAALCCLALPAFAQTLPPAAPAAPSSEPDLAFGAYQRGRYLTALTEATKRAQKNDPAAMTLLGELYANGYGVGRDDSKAAQWYKLAAAGGDRNALFALAMFDFEGRAGPRNEADGAHLLEAAAKLGHAAAAYDLGLLYLQGKQFPQDFARAAQLFKQAADAGNQEAQYALAVMLKEGRGVPPNMRQAMQLMARAADAGNVDAMVEFAIAAFNGTGAEHDELVARAAFHQGGAARFGHRAEPAGAHLDGGARPARRSRQRHQMAPDRGCRRRPGPRTRRLRRQAAQAVREAADAAAKKWLATAPPPTPAAAQP